MRWVYAAGMTAALILVAIVGPSFLGSDGEDKTAPSSAAAGSQAPLSEWVQPDRLQKSIQLLVAMQDLRDDAAAVADSHELVLTIRDEPPLDIWRADGSMCVTDEEPPPMIEITRNDGTQVQPATEVPAQALLEDGACEATTTIPVEDENVYYVGIKLAGRDNPKTTGVVRESAVQEVTLSR